MTRCDRCKRFATTRVGWGQPPMWVCMECFKKKCQEVRATVEKAIATLSDNRPAPQVPPDLPAL